MKTNSKMNETANLQGVKGDIPNGCWPFTVQFFDLFSLEIHKQHKHSNSPPMRTEEIPNDNRSIFFESL